MSNSLKTHIVTFQKMKMSTGVVLNQILMLLRISHLILKESDEILKFIIYMMKSCGTPGVPSFEKVKNIWSDDLDIDEMLKKNTDKDGNISWMIKHMDILKLQMSNPKIGKKIVRYPTVETTIACHRQSGAAKWIQEINFPWAKIGDTTFLQNMFVRFECEGQENLGQIKKFMDDIENNKLLAELEIFCYNTDENNGTPKRRPCSS